MTEDPRSTILFVFGPARGGTTYLNTLLRTWFDFGMGPEGTFLLPLYRRLAKFGDLNDPVNQHRLASEISKSEMLEIIRKHYPPHLRFDITPEDILARMADASYPGIALATFACVADFMGKSRIGNKYPDYWMDLPTIEKLFPGQARYLGILRDGRDVFLSSQHVWWGKQNAYIAAKHWKKMTERIDSFRASIEPDRLLTIQYEALLQSPKSTLEDLEAFFSAPLSEETRGKFLEEAGSNALKANFHKWKSSMSSADQLVFEAVAGEQLRSLGYETVFEHPTLSKRQIVGFQLHEWIRLVKLNIGHIFRKLRGD